MDEKDVVYIYTMGYCSATRKDNILSFFFYNMDEPWADYAKGDKSDMHVCMLSHI